MLIVIMSRFFRARWECVGWRVLLLLLTYFVSCGVHGRFILRFVLRSSSALCRLARLFSVVFFRAAHEDQDTWCAEKARMHVTLPLPLCMLTDLALGGHHCEPYFRRRHSWSRVAPGDDALLLSIACTSQSSSPASSVSRAPAQLSKHLKQEAKVRSTLAPSRGVLADLCNVFRSQPSSVLSFRAKCLASSALIVFSPCSRCSHATQFSHELCLSALW